MRQFDPPAGVGEPPASGRLPNDAFVLLDPAVDVLDTGAGEYHLLSHGHFEAGMVVPPGDGLLAFVTALRQPINLAHLRAQFDDQDMIDKMLASLLRHGFIHVTSPSPLSAEELARHRSIARETRDLALRHTVVIDLDTPISAEKICDRLREETAAPELLLQCARLADHKALFAELARLRQSGVIRIHQTIVQTGRLSGDPDLCRSLNRVGASVTLDAVSWPVPDASPPALDAMTRHRVAVHALMTPDLSILDAAVRRQAQDWASAMFISGLCLRLDPEALWPDRDAGEDDFIALFEAVLAIENEFGDVAIVNLPSDEVLLGNTASSMPDDRPAGFAGDFRTAYLRWRLPILKACENDNSWSQIPEAEDRLVRAQDDLLPNHPDLLKLRPGSVLVDVCGGLGRVARRLSPAVGDDGLVISIEMYRCLSDRARRFACERNFTNLHFRPGLAQRLPLPDATADAAVNEWTGGIWELGLGPAMIGEMARVVRPGGRIAVTHRLVRLSLDALARPWVQYDDIYKWIREAFVHPGLSIVVERIWGQIVPSMIGDNATLWRKQYMPRLINPYDVIYKSDDGPGARADVYLTIIAQRQ